MKPSKRPLSPALTHSHQLSPALTSSHSLSPALTRAHLRSPPVTCAHRLSPALIRAHPCSPALTCSHHLSPALTTSHLLSPPLTTSHQLRFDHRQSRSAADGGVISQPLHPFERAQAPGSCPYMVGVSITRNPGPPAGRGRLFKPLLGHLRRDFDRGRRSKPNSLSGGFEFLETAGLLLLPLLASSCGHLSGPSRC